MKKLIMRFIPSVFSVLSILLASCSDLNKKDQLTKIDEMNESLDSIKTVLLENKIDTITQLMFATSQVEQRIKTNYVSDTINMELAKKMNAFKVSRKRLRPLGKSYNNINHGVEEEKEALRLLKSDIENGSGGRNKYNEYVMFEESKVHQLRMLLKDYVSSKSKTITELDKLYPEMNEFSLSLLNKKDNQQ